MLWSIASAVCAALAIIHLLIWLESVRRPPIFSSRCVVRGGGDAVAEMGMLKAATVESYAFALRASFAAISLLVVSMVWYVREYFGNGRRWLAVAVTASWALVLSWTPSRLSVRSFGESWGCASGKRRGERPSRSREASRSVRPGRGCGRPGSLPVLRGCHCHPLPSRRPPPRDLRRRSDRHHPPRRSSGAVRRYRRFRVPYVVTFVYLGVVIVAGYPLTAEVFERGDSRSGCRRARLA